MNQANRPDRLFSVSPSLALVRVIAYIVASEVPLWILPLNWNKKQTDAG